MNSVSILQRTRPMLLAAALPVVLFNFSCKPVDEISDNASSSEPALRSAPVNEAEPAPAPGPEAATETRTKPEPVPVTKPSSTSEPPAVAKPETTSQSPVAADPVLAPGNLAVATFGNGCFWCTEAVMERLDGVSEAKSGYMGGHVENPTYEQVCEKKTGHVEVVQVTYDPAKISYEDLLDIFWHSHDPTTKDRQGNDVGPQYRSVIFFHTPDQKAAAENSMAKENASGDYGAPIVTEITDASTFWEAEGYHQDFFAKNPGNYYCRMTIPAKLRKLGLE